MIETFNASANRGFYQMLDPTGTGELKWSIDNGRLPNGITLSSAGLLSGTPTENGTFNVVIRVTNDIGYDTKAFIMSVFSETVIINPSLPFALTSQDYSQQLLASGEGPFTWSIASGTLPAGLTLNTSTGIISGRATSDGASTFTIRVAGKGNEAEATFTINVYTLPQITNVTLGHAVYKESFSIQLTASGTTPVTFAHYSGSLPDGLTITPQGLLSGTSTKEGSFTFAISATNAGGYTTREFTFNVFTKPVILLDKFEDAVVGREYTKQITVSGTAPITFSVSSGSLPIGLILNEGTGVVTGTPTTSGQTSFNITAFNAHGTHTLSYTLFVGELPLLITTQLGFTILGEEAIYNLEAVGTGPLMFEVSDGALPPGLYLSNTGVISGVSNVKGEYNFIVKVSNKFGYVERPLRIHVFSRPAITTDSVLPHAIVGEVYNVQLEAIKSD